MFMKEERELAVVSEPATLGELASGYSKGKHLSTYMKRAALTMTSSWDKS